jgi:hypothetical protein
MTENTEILYSKNVIEFITVAKEFCIYIENSEKQSKENLLNTLQKFLPLLYIKASLIPKVEPFSDEGNENFVTETHWNKINTILSSKFNADDTYRDIYDNMMNELNEVSNMSLSEDLTDIYQDTKNFISQYNFGNEEIMNDALWECKNNFEIYWGNRLLSALKTIHILIYRIKDED